jgi:hypothetical protein
MASSCSSFDFALRAWGFGWTVLALADWVFAAVFFPLVIVAPWIDSTGGLPVPLQSLQVPMISSRNADHPIALFAAGQPFHGCHAKMSSASTNGATRVSNRALSR